MDRKISINDFPDDIKSKLHVLDQRALGHLWLRLEPEFTNRAHMVVASKDVTYTGRGLYHSEAGLYIRTMALILGMLMRALHSRVLGMYVMKTHFMDLYNEWILREYPRVGALDDDGKLKPKEVRADNVSSATSRAWKTIVRLPLEHLDVADVAYNIRPYIYIAEDSLQEVSRDGSLVALRAARDYNTLTNTAYMEAVRDYDKTTLKYFEACGGEDDFIYWESASPVTCTKDGSSALCQVAKQKGCKPCDPVAVKAHFRRAKKEFSIQTVLGEINVIDLIADALKAVGLENVKVKITNKKWRINVEKA